MFSFAFAIGMYSYLIFSLGIVGWLYKPVIIGVTLVFLGSVFLLKRNFITNLFRNLLARLKQVPHDRLFYILLLLFILQIVVNVIGVLGPELAFDALWYHLTLPKLYLQNHSIAFIPGGLLYYSAMPKLTEMLYLGALAVDGETLAKFIHFSFGLLTCAAIYLLSRKFSTPIISLVAVIIFYSNIVVAWESTTAYIDLTRAFFEIMALWAFVAWWQEGKKNWFVLSAIMIGFAITTKLIAIGSLLIFSTFIVWKLRQKLKSLFLQIVSYWFIALLTPLPWFVFTFFYTGSPVYPFFTDMYPVNPVPLSLLGFISDSFLLFTQASDPVSPIYLIILPLLIIVFSKLRGEIKLLTIYSLFALIIWYITPRTGGGRFILPYLPAMSIVSASVIAYFLENKKKFGDLFGKFLIGIVIFFAVVTIGYRFMASIKYLPVIFGRESKQDFLMQHLNFSYGDVYDTNGDLKKQIEQKDTVLLSGFHNLYYLDFLFIHESWLQKGDSFTYIATQNTELPREYRHWKLVYENKQTMVKLYKR